MTRNPGLPALQAEKKSPGQRAISTSSKSAVSAWRGRWHHLRSTDMTSPPTRSPPPGCTSTSRDAVATVTLDRPEERNAQTPAMWRALAAIGEELPDDVRVVVVRGAGQSFCAGLDRAMLDPGTGDVARLLELDDEAISKAIDGYQQGFTWLRDPQVRVHRGGAGLRHRGRVPARAQLRPAGGGRGRPVLHEGARAGAGAGPDGNKAAGRGGWVPGALEICATARMVGATRPWTSGWR